MEYFLEEERYKGRGRNGVQHTRPRPKVWEVHIGWL